jgi:hypothetical protein
MGESRRRRSNRAGRAPMRSPGRPQERASGLIAAHALASERPRASAPLVVGACAGCPSAGWFEQGFDLLRESLRHELEPIDGVGVGAEAERHAAGGGDDRYSQRVPVGNFGE